MANTVYFENAFDLIVIGNKAQLLDMQTTNYWETEHAKRGALFLTWNAGAARLLVPDQHLESIREMRTAKYVIISHGPYLPKGGREAFELLFEDKSDSPFVVTIGENQSDGRIAIKPIHGSFPFTVWTRKGLRLRFTAKYREVPMLPFLEPWSDDITTVKAS